MTYRIHPLLFLIAVQLMLLLPWVKQPMHMDDGIYVDLGRNVFKSPWHPEDLPYIFEGQALPDLAGHSHPPFLGYWIALLLWLGGGRNIEMTLHLGFLLFPILFGIGMYRLSLRFAGGYAVSATLLAITSPALIVMSHTVMTDIPTLALSTLAIALYVCGIDDGKQYKLWLSGILLAAASLCSYTALPVAGLCWLYAALKRSTLRAARWAPLVAILAMIFWLAYSSYHFGRFVGGDVWDYIVQSGSFGWQTLFNKALAFLTFLVPTLLLPLPLLQSVFKQVNRTVVLLSVAVAAVVTYLSVGNYSFAEQCFVAILLLLGGWLIVGLALKVSRVLSSVSARRSDVLFLAAWLGLITVQVLVLFTSGMARYLLPLLPPIVLLIFQRSSAEPENRLRLSTLVAVFAGLVLGISLSSADYEMARAHQQSALSLGRELENWKNKTSFGAEWGFRYYMSEQGFRQFTGDSDDLRGGQFVISPLHAVPYSIAQDVESMLVPAFQQEWHSRIPIHLMSKTLHAGFYSSAWGLLPFAISTAPVEEITVRQVSYLVERLPEIQVEMTDRDRLIPLPATGGVDLVLPQPARLVIPVDGPFPMRIRFSCIAAAAHGCPVRVAQISDSTESEIVVHEDASEAADPVFYFDLDASAPTRLVLETHSSDRNDSIRIRNWVLLPAATASSIHARIRRTVARVCGRDRRFLEVEVNCHLAHVDEIHGELIAVGT